jgi:hypothetical protein
VEWTLLYNLAKKHEQAFSEEQGEDDEGPDFWVSSVALSGPIKEKLEPFLKQYKHRQQILKETPRKVDDETSVLKTLHGLIAEFKRGKDLKNQVKPETEVSLEFEDDEWQLYGKLSEYVLDNWKEMKTRKGPKQIMHLAIMELRFWYGCDLTWRSAQEDPHGAASASEKAPPLEALGGEGGAAAAAEASEAAVAEVEAAENEEESEEEEEEEEEVDDDDLPNSNFVAWDPADPYSIINWDRIKYPSSKKMATAREFHAISLMFFFDKDLAAKFPEFNGTVHKSWHAHYNRTMNFIDIMRLPDVGPFEYDDNDRAWLAGTARYYLARLSSQERENLGISVGEARKYLQQGKDRQVMCCLILSTSEPRADDGG